MGLRVIACVQPLCGRRTGDFYSVAYVDAAQLNDVEAGLTCAPCWHKIAARLARESSNPRGNLHGPAGSLVKLRDLFFGGG